MQTAFEIYLKPATLQSAVVTKPNFLAHTQQEHYFIFHLPPMFSAAGLWAFPPCCTLSVMFSRKQSSLSNLSRPAPWLFLAQDTFCITADVMGTTCHWHARLGRSALLNHLVSQPRCHLPASSAQGCCKGKPRPEEGKRKRLTYVAAFRQEGERTNILSLGTGTQREKSRRKKRNKATETEAPFTQVKWHLLSRPLTQLLWLTA